MPELDASLSKLSDNEKSVIFALMPYQQGPEELLFSDGTPPPNVREIVDHDRVKTRQFTTIRIKGSLSRSPDTIFDAIERIATGVRCFTTLILDPGVIGSRVLRCVTRLLPRVRNLEFPKTGFDHSCTDTDLHNFATAIAHAPGLKRISCGDLIRYNEHVHPHAVADAAADAIAQSHTLECLVLTPTAGRFLTETWVHRRPFAPRVTVDCLFPVPDDTHVVNWSWFLDPDAPTRCLTLKGDVHTNCLPPRYIMRPDAPLRNRRICLNPKQIVNPVLFGALLGAFRDTAQWFTEIRCVLDTNFLDSVRYTLTCVDTCFELMDHLPNSQLSVEWRISDPSPDWGRPDPAGADFRYYIGLLQNARKSVCDPSKTSRLVISAKPAVVKNIDAAFKKDDEKNGRESFSNCSWRDVFDRKRLRLKQVK